MYSLDILALPELVFLDLPDFVGVGSYLETVLVIPNFVQSR